MRRHSLAIVYALLLAMLSFVAAVGGSLLSDTLELIVGPSVAFESVIALVLGFAAGLLSMIVMGKRISVRSATLVSAAFAVCSIGLLVAYLSWVAALPPALTPDGMSSTGAVLARQSLSDLSPWFAVLPSSALCGVALGTRLVRDDRDECCRTSASS